MGPIYFYCQHVVAAVVLLVVVVIIIEEGSNIQIEVAKASYDSICIG